MGNIKFFDRMHFSFLSIVLVVLLNLPKIDVLALNGSDQGIRIDDIIIIILAIYSLIFRSGLNNFPKVILGTYAYILTSSIFSVFVFPGNDYLRLIFALRLLEYSLFFCSAYTLRRHIDILLILNCTIIIQAMVVGYELYIGSARPQGSLAGPWELSSIIGILILYLIPNMSKMANLSYISVLIAFIILTLSKAALVAVLISYAFLIRFRFVLFFILVLVFFLVVFYFRGYEIPLLREIFGRDNFLQFRDFLHQVFTADTIKRVDPFSFNDGSSSFIMRLNIWANLIDLWKSIDYLHIVKYLFGIGLGSVAVNIDGYYVRLFFELGIFGFLLYTFIMYRNIKLPRTRGLTIYLCIICLTLDPYTSSKIAYCLGIVFAHFKYENDQKISESG